MERGGKHLPSPLTTDIPDLKSLFDPGDQFIGPGILFFRRCIPLFSSVTVRRTVCLLQWQRKRQQTVPHFRSIKDTVGFGGLALKPKPQDIMKNIASVGKFLLCSNKPIYKEILETHPFTIADDLYFKGFKWLSIQFASTLELSVIFSS